MRGEHSAAWTDFWAGQGSGGQRAAGCLPERWHGIEQVQHRFWQAFAKPLPRGARLLDLATGNGCVMAACLSTRRDLKPVGVDLAERIPEPPKGAKSKPGVAMESLPFPDHRFHAVTSQFGFEYGDIGQVAREIARVLRPDGQVGLMTHRIDGPILEHNRKRREQIRWVLEEKRLVELARRSLALRGMGLTSLPAEIAEAPAEGALLFGAGSAAWEISEAIRQSLAMGANDHPANVARLIDAIVGKAANEAGRIDSLESACEATADQATFHRALADAGLIAIDCVPVEEQGTRRPFADFRTFRLN